ncbi:MAG: hypothetical protein IJT03_07490 [Clostridia bacterium]|nr:hypothetical protein [Clostridia bacterium]
MEMQKYKSRYMRIAELFIAVTVVISSAMLVASGIAVARVNSEYMESGVRAAKIIAVRDSEQISVSLSDKLMYKSDGSGELADKILSILPPPVNTVYISVRELLRTFEE